MNTKDFGWRKAASSGASAVSDLQGAYEGGNTIAGVTAEGALTFSVADTGNVVGLTVVQNDVTNNPEALVVTNTGTGDSLAINSDEFVVGPNGDVTIKGNLIVQGDSSSIESETIRVGDNHLYMNDGYTVAVAQTGGLVVNRLPTATIDTVAAGGFTAGVAAVSNPTIATTGATTFALSDIIQVSGANNDENNGLYEVLSHAANVLIVRGIGLTATVEDFTQNQLVTDTTVAGAITKVTVDVIRAGTDGVWETGSGSSTGITFTDLALSSGVTFQDAYEGGNTISATTGEGTPTITVADTGNTSALIINQNDVTNNPTAFEVYNTGTGKAFYMETAVVGAHGAEIHHTGANFASLQFSNSVSGQGFFVAPFIALNASGEFMLYNPTNTKVIIGNNATEMITLESNTEVVINETGSDIDFRIESDTDTHAFFIQGNDGNIGIGKTTPNARLDIDGDGTNYALKVNNTSTGDGIMINTANATTNNGILWNQGTDEMFNVYSDTGNDTKMQLSNSGIVQVLISTDSITYFNGGNVGIGTDSPTEKFEVFDDVNGSLKVNIRNQRHEDDAGLSVINFEGGTSADARASIATIVAGKEEVWTTTASTQDGYLVFKTALNGSVDERIRITSNGYIGVGASNPITDFDLSKSASDSELSINSYSTTDSHQPELQFSKSSSATIGTAAETADGENLGRISWWGGDSGNLRDVGAAIGVVQNGTSGTKVPTDIYFQISTDTASLQEAMRITKDGYVGIGTTSSNYKLEVSGEDVNNSTLALTRYENATGSSLIRLRKARGTEAVPAAINSGDYTGAIRGQGYDGSAFGNSAEIDFKATENWNGTSHGSQILFYTIDDATTTQDLRMTIDQDGAILMDGESGSSVKLLVEGSTQNAARIRTNHTGVAGTNAPGYELYNEGDFKGGLFYRESADTVDLFYDDGSDPAISIDTNGNVGIGNQSDPTRLLHLGPNTTTSVQAFTTSNTGHTATDGTAIGVDSSSNAFILNYEDTDFDIYTNNTRRLNITNDGKFATGGEISPDVSLGGICLNQGSADADILTFKSSDIAHGLVTQDETDTYCSFIKSFADNGGLTIRAYQDGSQSGYTFNWRAFQQGTASTATSTAAIGVIRAEANQHDGADTVSAVAANGNLYTISNGSNCRVIFKGDGDVEADGTVTSNSYDFAEYFESYNGESIANGTPVVFDKDGKIREAKEGEKPFGVVSATACFIGNKGLGWKDRYLKDNFGAVFYDKDGYPKINPEYNPEQEYINREDRPEWNIVGLVGQVYIKKGSPINPDWIFIKNANEDADLYLIK